LEHPEELFLTSARIHYVSDKSIQSRVLCVRRNTPRPRAGGQNRVLTAEQATAILQYNQEAAEYAVGAARDIVIAAISYLCAQEHPLKPLPK
jgi:hypothetical protein